MRIRELQQKVADALNALDEFMQGGCMAFAEDARDVYDRASKWVSGGRVAVVVVTPEMTRNGDAADALPAETQLLIQCSEKPAASRIQPGVITALDAAEVVMHALDGRQFCWLSTRQTIDRQSGVLTATVTFATTIHLS